MINSSSSNVPPPPPLQQQPLVVNNTSTNTTNNNNNTFINNFISNINGNELNSIKSKLKKPTNQHVVDFKERYEQALRNEQDEKSKLFNRKFIYCNNNNSWIRIENNLNNLNNNENIIKNIYNEMIEFPKELKIITLNTWFANILQDQRYTEQLNVFKNLNVDIICLQEVIPLYVIDFITKNDFIKNNYIISDIDGNSIDPYGVMILIKKNLPILDIKINKLTTRMGRCLINCTFAKNIPNLDIYLKYLNSINNNDINSNIEELEKLIPTYAIIGTVHLESLSSKERRHVQLNEIYSIYNQYPNTEIKMLMGDFNFDSSSIENDQLLTGNYKDYKDIWYYLYPNIEGKTFLYQNNRKGQRLDRILLNSKNYIPKEIKIIGNEKLILNEQDQLKLKQSFSLDYTCMSDHFGLYSEIYNIE
ncbi:predicted protein [Naegleria gruberi]|uniref:Predicted protein n=1 Tax=Naegleria gruberi TaxID=5762 RepID=D2W5C1_NAEGR|nr:uncharacterized protein NAEGRDRAFT_76611 [Naegleria gruberi]EFC35732.1 predicted protein [Naegleria gruberi]|eukprot:XP_002668476.1 predicted protein [Naegleria gruberi strain NEG-M]